MDRILEIIDCSVIIVGQTGIFMKVHKDGTDDAAAPSRREDEGQRE